MKAVAKRSVAHLPTVDGTNLKDPTLSTLLQRKEDGCLLEVSQDSKARRRLMLRFESSLKAQVCFP
jgi:hypothetical protein